MSTRASGLAHLFDAPKPHHGETPKKEHPVGSKENPAHVVTDSKKRDWKGYAIMGGVSVLAGGTVGVGNNTYQNHKQDELRQDYTA